LEASIAEVDLDRKQYTVELTSRDGSVAVLQDSVMDIPWGERSRHDAADVLCRLRPAYPVDDLGADLLPAARRDHERPATVKGSP